MKLRNLSQLANLAELMLDHRLACLRQTADAKARSEMALSAMGRTMPESEERLEGVAAELSMLAYQRWTAARRGEINLSLARQTHAWLDAQSAAQLAFGKAEVLRKLEKVRNQKR